MDLQEKLYSPPLSVLTPDDEVDYNFSHHLPDMSWILLGTHLDGEEEQLHRTSLIHPADSDGKPRHSFNFNHFVGNFTKTRNSRHNLGKLFFFNPDKSCKTWI